MPKGAGSRSVRCGGDGGLRRRGCGDLCFRWSPALGWVGNEQRSVMSAADVRGVRFPPARLTGSSYRVIRREATEYDDVLARGAVWIQRSDPDVTREDTVISLWRAAATRRATADDFQRRIQALAELTNTDDMPEAQRHGSMRTSRSKECG